jgi:hypothetical protein
MSLPRSTRAYLHWPAERSDSVRFRSASERRSNSVALALRARSARFLSMPTSAKLGFLETRFFPRPPTSSWPAFRCSSSISPSRRSARVAHYCRCAMLSKRIESAHECSENQRRAASRCTSVSRHQSRDPGRTCWRQPLLHLEMGPRPQGRCQVRRYVHSEAFARLPWPPSIISSTVWTAPSQIGTGPIFACRGCVFPSRTSRITRIGLIAATDSIEPN